VLSLVDPFEYLILLGGMAIAVIWGVAAVIAKFFTRK
jgi:hypothetical protein